ncbi:MAG TPA: copper amine oxidase N-terminal domain-containing protein [Candidatus Baltobacteraceae bacterium]|nr:copper amine oxidase N-terminal domain-containing protein [Candidatus Baltobacteraceae bacterium]
MVPILMGVAVVAANSMPAQPVPILFNDHHVMASPDKLTHGRVLAALVRGGTVLVPLRSMFEGMGATVTYDAGSKTVRVSKQGADVSVRVGVPEVTINGETRPLDVAPEMYQGIVMVPIRVLSEGMGAYVLWVPDRQTVVVRYAPATPAPTAAPTEAPTAVPPTPSPSPSPRPKPKNEYFIAGDYLIGGKTYNEFSAGYRSSGSWLARAAGEFGPFMLGFDYSQYRYPHNCSNPAIPTTDCLVTVVGNTGQTAVPAFTARDTFSEAHLGYKIFNPRVYVGIAWQFNAGNYGYPNQTGFGFGAEKLPDLDNVISYYGSYYFYPNTRGTYSAFNQSLPMQYSLRTYKIGATWTFAKPIFFELGYAGNRGNAKANSPNPGYTHNGYYAGFGAYFNP